VAAGKMNAWALAAGGQEGVEQMLELVRLEIETTMALLGVTKLKQLDSSYIARVDPGVGAGPFPLL
jgi:isopentenyl diphosphate isomerase/L-lactate dehydrogenase-like FMN-dependent dehydrogenase